MAKRHLSLGLFLCIHASCTSTELCVAPCGDGEGAEVDNVTTVSGTACTLPPSVVGFPYKILFILDDSGSTRDSDPDNVRYDQMQNAIDAYISNPNIWFGVISFSTTAVARTTGFTRDRPTLAAITGDHLVTTDYVAALTLAKQFIQQDAEALPDAERARTRYDIQFLSDGQPNVDGGCETLEAVQAATQQVKDLEGSLGLFSINLSTIYLNYNQVSDCDLDGPSYLQPMASIGSGTFQDVALSDIQFQIHFVEIHRPFDQRDIFVVNENRVVYADYLRPDSDGDGLRDDDPQEPDPTLADADGDGCPERLDSSLTAVCADLCSDEIASGATLATLPDLDSDTLANCVEKSLGYNKSRVDTDFDGLPDFLEFAVGTNALDASTLTLDSDRDGVKDLEEVRTGTNPSYPERDRSLAYVYDVLTPVDAALAGTKCFKFSVGNVRLVQTLATPASHAGDNLVCVYVVQTPVDDPSGEPLFTRACQTANYRYENGADRKTPANGLLAFTPADFVPVYTKAP